MPSNVLVSGLVDSESYPNNSQYNGLYVYDGEVNGRPSYVFGSFSIFWEGSYWLFGSLDQSLYSESDVAYPWLAIDWNQDGDIDPTGFLLTEVPVSSQPTFGLPADVVALITSRFGTVANFLRLRNQGQV